MSLGDRLDAHKENLDAVKEDLDRVEYCIEHCAECNDWEDDFLHNIKDWLMRGRTLSFAQAEKLEQIEYMVEFGRDLMMEEYGFHS